MSVPDAFKVGAIPDSQVTDAGKVSANALPFTMMSRTAQSKLAEGTPENASVEAPETVRRCTRAPVVWLQSRVVVPPTLYVGVRNGTRSRASSFSSAVISVFRN